MFHLPPKLRGAGPADIRASEAASDRGWRLLFVVSLSEMDATLSSLNATGGRMNAELMQFADE